MEEIEDGNAEDGDDQKADQPRGIFTDTVRSDRLDCSDG